MEATFNGHGLNSKFNFSFLKKAFEKFVAYRKRKQMIKRTIRELSACTDRELSDMGIARGDIWAIAHGDTSYQRARVNENLKGWV